MSSRPKLLLIDGHHFAYRSYYAIKSMYSPQGEPVNAIYGFIYSVKKIIREVDPQCIAVVWDGGLDDERTEVLGEYKMDRDPMPDELEVQLDCIEEWLNAEGLYSCCQEGIEADDIIGTLCDDAINSGAEVIIASADKDFFQLVSDNVSIHNPNDKKGGVWGISHIVDKTGVTPSQIVDWLSLMGDAVDGISGVQGVGPKTAAKLLKEYGTINGIFESVNTIKSEKLRSSLLESKQDIERNQDLIRLKTIEGHTFDPEKLQIKHQSIDELSSLYKRWGFKKLLEALGDLFER